MKKLIFMLMLFVLVGVFVETVNGAVSACESQCGKSRNIGIEELTKLREALDNCRPLFLECTRNGRYSLCQKDYFNCKWGKIKEIKDTTIEINKNYQSCVNACRNTNKVEEISFVKKEISPFCMSLQQTQSSLISHFGEAKFKEVLRANKCV